MPIFRTRALRLTAEGLAWNNETMEQPMVVLHAIRLSSFRGGDAARRGEGGEGAKNMYTDMGVIRPTCQHEDPLQRAVSSLYLM